MESRGSPTHLYNGLKLPRIAQRVLNDHLADVLCLAVLAPLDGRAGEEDLAVAHGPAALPGKVDDGALGLEKEQRLGAAEREGRVRALAT